MKKRVWIMIMAALTAFFLVSCGKETPGAAQTPEPTPAEAPAPSPCPAPSPSPLPSPTPEPTPEPEYPTFGLTVLHTNDWHGNLDNVPRYATLIGEIRAEEENVLLLDGGDIFRRGPFEEWMGEVEIRIMNAMGYDALAFGNNDYPLNDRELDDVSLHPVVQLAEFPLLSANVTIDGEPLEGFAPYTVLNVGGLDIAIVGVTSMKPHNRENDISKWADFTEPDKAVEALLEEVRGVSDIQIVLSHAGIVADRRMRGVHAIIGADDHLKLFDVIEDGDREIPVVQAGGEEDHYLGRLDLRFAQIDGVWVLRSFDGRLLSIEDVLPDGDVQLMIGGYQTDQDIAA